MPGITDHLIRFAQTQPPRDALAMLRLSLFDWTACGIAGAQDSAFDGFVAVHHASGGTAEATVLGGGKLPVATAALINGTLSHALDYDDTHFAHIGHPSVAVLPAVLAIAERDGLALSQVIEAATLGIEASIHVGIWLGRDHYQVGYHQTATAGAFGATLAVARLMKLDADRTRMALGLCASLASGLKSQFGTMAKPLNAGLAARAGVEAAVWAQAGMTAAPDGLAGPLGFGPTHHGEGDEAALATIGQGVWQIESISHKFHACCHGLHAMLEALGDTQIDPLVIARIDIETHPRWMSVCNIADPDTGLGAKFSYRQTAAMSLLGQDTGAIASYTEAITTRSDVISLRNLINVAENPDLSEMQSRVKITLKNGDVHELQHDLNAAIPADIRASKLRSKAAGLLGQAQADALWVACQGDDAAALMAQLV
ncbi:MmgE/PrpD family protein [Roseobacter sp. GAI101]|uniref:MmgE/PrpD family protein n=1 Tax=Roseobacter sp. (strain GAI101) TaxID=391589 RepID=UPI00018720AC|nr:MmgE/PrpD family protein [Roseobacter sp. GAI101]EEB86300.1 MmgE/PrpD family protein [Roseobacter sp. GAI101]